MNLEIGGPVPEHVSASRTRSVFRRATPGYHWKIFDCIWRDGLREKNRAKRNATILAGDDYSLVVERRQESLLLASVQTPALLFVCHARVLRARLRIGP